MISDSKNIQTFKPEFFFRGNRNYIHSTDTYIALLDIVSLEFPGERIGKISISFRHIARSQLIVCFGQRPSFLDGSNPAVDFAIGTNSEDNVITGWMEESDEPVTEKRLYEESIIRCDSIIENNQITLKQECDAKPIEVLTSLAVHLHESYCPAPEGKKWLDTKLELNHPITKKETSSICIRINKLLGGKMSRSDILHNNDIIGRFMFVAG
jgi:hypothetical protein